MPWNADQSGSNGVERSGELQVKHSRLRSKINAEIDQGQRKKIITSSNEESYNSGLRPWLSFDKLSLIGRCPMTA
jgi:predicted AAA+ superfamily ATPase